MYSRAEIFLAAEGMEGGSCVAVGRTQSSSCTLEDICVVTKQKLELEVHFFASLWNISYFRRTN